MIDQPFNLESALADPHPEWRILCQRAAEFWQSKPKQLPVMYWWYSPEYDGWLLAITPEGLCLAAIWTQEDKEDEERRVCYVALPALGYSPVLHRQGLMAAKQAAQGLLNTALVCLPQAVAQANVSASADLTPVPGGSADRNWPLDDEHPLP